MKIISLNLCGLGDATKMSSLRHIFHLIQPYIILIQGTMTNKEKAINYFVSIYTHWHIVSADSFGLSSGLVDIWDPKCANQIAYKFFQGILLTRHVDGLSEDQK